jgi:AmpE protein
MILLKLLLALILERIWPRAPVWHWHIGFGRWLDWWLSVCRARPVAGLLVALSIPPLLVAGMLTLLPGPLAFLLELLVLLMHLGNPWLQQRYRRYLRALSRGDRALSLNCVREFARLRHPDHPGELGAIEVAALLTWINYRFYFAVLFFYLVAGAPAVVLYGSLVSARLLLLDRAGFRLVVRRLQQVLRCLDWLPVRMIMLGYVVMGEPERSLPVWLASLSDWRRPEAEWLADVASAAANLDVTVDPMLVQTTCHLVALAKRTLVLFLGIIAALTLYGYVT